MSHSEASADADDVIRRHVVVQPKCINNGRCKLPDEALRTVPETGTPKNLRCLSGLSPVLEVLIVTVFFALVSGFSESGYWLFKKHVLREVTFMPPGVFWMAPIGYLILFVFPGAGLALMAWRLGETAFVWDAVRLLALLAALSSVFLLGTSLHFVAQLLLAAGIASVVTAFLERRAAKTRSWIRVSTIAMLATLGTLVTCGLCYRYPSVAVDTPRDHSARPNILLIVLDTVRADKLGCYKTGPSPTPNLDALANNGVVFEQATSTAPWTLPSTASMFTGRLPRELSADWFTRLDDRFPTIAEFASQNGYATAGFVANTRYCGSEVGLARGFQYFDDYGTTLADILLCTAAVRRFTYSFLSCRFGCTNAPGRKKAAAINDAFLVWHDQLDKHPYFVVLNYLDAHDPYVAPPPFNRHRPINYAQRTQMRFWWSLHKKHVTAKMDQLSRNAYTDCIRYLDHQIGLLLRELEQRSGLQNTAVIITSDHGEHLGEHGLYLHGNSLFQELIHVPLIVCWPGRAPRGARVSEPVSLTQLPSTMAEIIAETSSPFEGKTLQQTWGNAEGSPSWNPIISEIITPPEYPPCQGTSPAFRGSMTAVRLGRFKLIRNENGEEDLYDLADDPGEHRNLVASEKHGPILDKLRAIEIASGRRRK